MSALIDVPRPLSQTEQAFVDQLRPLVPKDFLKECPGGWMTDIRLLGIAQLALDDFNNMPPQESLTLSTCRGAMWSMVNMGAIYYINVFKQMEYSLIDISYSDQGLSINLDRVGKIGQVIQQVEKLWLRLLQNRKNVSMLKVGGAGLGTPRFQSNLSRVIASVGQGAYGWGLP
jgi:hypothetical protein